MKTAKTQKSASTTRFIVKAKIQNRTKRINHKSKRLRNLIKKAIELSQMCDLDISIVIRDREMGKFTQYGSNSEETGDVFTHEKALAELKSHATLTKNLKVYTNEDYQKLTKVMKRENGEGNANDSDNEDDQECQSLLGKRAVSNQIENESSTSTKQSKRKVQEQPPAQKVEEKEPIAEPVAPPKVNVQSLFKPFHKESQQRPVGIPVGSVRLPQGMVVPNLPNGVRISADKSPLSIKLGQIQNGP